MADEPLLKSLNSRWNDVRVTAQTCVLGRNPACNVVFEDNRISQLHARVWLKTQPYKGVFVDDLSTNGVFVNGTKIGKGYERELKDGDLLSFVVTPTESNGIWSHSDRSIVDSFVAYKLHWPVVGHPPSLGTDGESSIPSEPAEQSALLNNRGRSPENQNPNDWKEPAHGTVPSAQVLAVAEEGRAMADAKEFASSGDKVSRAHSSSSEKSTETSPASSPTGASLDNGDDELAKYLMEHMQSEKFSDDFEKKGLIGEGGFAKVFAGEHKATKLVVAVKEIDKVKWNAYNQTHLRPEQLIEEFQLHSKLVHKNIVRLYTMYNSQTHLRIILEKVGGGDLFDFLAQKNANGLDEKTAKHMFKGILRAVAIMHENGICHRDLKPENVLVSEDGKTLKIADFGLAKFVGEKRGGKTMCGTTMYMAPEVAASGRGGGNYGTKADVWGLGVILYVMLVCYLPFDEEDHVLEKMLAKEVGNSQISIKDIFEQQKWDNVSEEAKDLIRKMLTPDESKRYTATQALQHPWLASAPASSKRARTGSSASELQTCTKKAPWLNQ